MNVELLAVTEDPEKLIEAAGRTCYQSAEKARPGAAGDYVARLIASGHESPVEHAYATFRITGCSRAMTHQLVRHRLLAVSQQSQRYVSEKAFQYIMPPSIEAAHADEFRADMEVIRAMYCKWKERGVKNEDARYVLPNACATEIVISGNFREFRHIFRVRCTPQAQWEIRDVCRAMLRMLLQRAPGVFGDLAHLAGAPGAGPDDGAGKPETG